MCQKIWRAWRASQVAKPFCRQEKHHADLVAWRAEQQLAEQDNSWRSKWDLITEGNNME
jgi:endogenous inhibitor of DNA gyrase (YacG/DUF329 family)